MIESVFHKAKSEGPLYALFLNCTLKKSQEVSNTEALCKLLIERLEFHEPDIETEIVPALVTTKERATNGRRSSTKSNDAIFSYWPCRYGWGCGLPSRSGLLSASTDPRKL